MTSDDSKQTFLVWKPLPSVPTRLILDELIDSFDGLTVLLSGLDSPCPRLKLSFTSFIAYRNINESFRLRTWSAFPSSSDASLMTVQHSIWVRCLMDEANGSLANRSLLHYAIYTGEDCVDVVSEIEPTAEWLK